MTVKYYTDEAGTKKIVLKEGRVSCSCCVEPECCMYPAQALYDGLYTYEDLPDEIIANGDTMIKLDPPEVAINTYAPDLAYYIGQGSAPIGSGDEDIMVVTSESLPIEPSQWTRWFGGNILGGGFCLLNLSAGTDETFADAYNISGPISGTVTRENICEWTGANLRLTNFGFQWKVNGNNKTGLQNTPVGSYAGGFSVS